MSIRKADYFPTPPDAVEALSLWLASRSVSYLREMFAARTIIEPCLGWGALYRFLRLPTPLTSGPLIDLLPGRADWHCYELQPDLASLARNHLGLVVRVGNSLEADLPPGLVLTNHPFTWHDEFVSLALDHVEAGKGPAILLAPCQKFGEECRAELRRRRPPTHELRLGWRLDFVGDGKSANALYAWYVWMPGRRPDTTITWWLERPTVSGELLELHRTMSARCGLTTGQQMGLFGRRSA